MKARRRQGKRARHGTRALALKAIQSAGGKGVLLTAQIRKRVAQLSSKRIPDYSLYQALRTLVRQKILQSRRVGREFSYRLRSSVPAASVAKRSQGPRKAPAPAVRATPEPNLGLHKLSPGEVVILEVGVTHVESARNHRGRLVLERHKRPA